MHHATLRQLKSAGMSGGILKLTKLSGRKVRPSTSPSTSIHCVTSLAHSWLNTPRFDGCLNFQCQPSTKWSANRLWGQVLRMKNEYRLSDHNILRTTYENNLKEELTWPLKAMRTIMGYSPNSTPLWTNGAALTSPCFKVTYTTLPPKNVFIQLENTRI